MSSGQCMYLFTSFVLWRRGRYWTVCEVTSVLRGTCRISPHSEELSERVYWNALLFDSDLLAEVVLLHFVIVRSEDTIGLPVVGLRTKKTLWKG